LINHKARSDWICTARWTVFLFFENLCHLVLTRVSVCVWINLTLPCVQRVKRGSIPIVGVLKNTHAMMIVWNGGNTCVYVTFVHHHFNPHLLGKRERDFYLNWIRKASSCLWKALLQLLMLERRKKCHKEHIDTLMPITSICVLLVMAIGISSKLKQFLILLDEAAELYISFYSLLFSRSSLLLPSTFLSISYLFTFAFHYIGRHAQKCTQQSVYNAGIMQ
jgi:hypothetical protein